MPSLNQIQIIFQNTQTNKRDSLFSGISIFQKNMFPLQKVVDGVSEWLMSGVKPNALSCAGCNEMMVMINNSNNEFNYIVTEMKCPLYRVANLGFRFL